MKTYHVCVICNKPIMGGGVLVDEREKDKFAHAICVHKPSVPIFGTLLRKVLK